MGSLNGHKFLILDSTFALKVALFSALHTDENSTKIVAKKNPNLVENYFLK